jgi:hypothetical protein
MLENLFNPAKQQAGEAIINNPAIPDQHNKEAVQEADHSIVDALKRAIMKRMLVSLALLSMSHLVQAQLPKMSPGANVGQLVTQLINAIKPTSFTSAFAGAKSGILDQASKISSAAGMASTVSSLVGYIKPDMFKTGSTAKSLLDMGARAKTMADGAILLKNFEGGLKPEALTGNWSGMRTGWLNALNQLALDQRK